MFCHLGHFFVCLSWRVCYFKGWSLRCSLGRGNAGRCTVTLYVGEGPRGSNGACFTLLWISVFHSATHNQTGPLWCWFPSKWACADARPLWVSPTTSPVRLGVSPSAASTPTGVFSQGFEALFPRAGTLGCAVCLAPQLFLPVYPHANEGPPAPQSAASLDPPAAASPPLLPVWMNVSSLSPSLLDFNAVRFSDNSGCFLFLNCCCPSFGCVRRCSVSTYASILARSPEI